MGNRAHCFTRQGLLGRRRGIGWAHRSFAMRFAMPLLVLLLLAWVTAPGLAQAAPVAGKPVPALDLFEEGAIPRVRLELSGEAMEKLRVSPRKYVIGAVMEGTRRYTNVSIRLKGG